MHRIKLFFKSIRQLIVANLRSQDGLAEDKLGQWHDHILL